MTEIKRKCSVCGGRLVLLTSTNEKLCSNCKETFKWELDDNQKPIFGRGEVMVRSSKEGEDTITLKLKVVEG